MKVMLDQGWQRTPTIAESTDRIMIQTVDGDEIRIKERDGGIEVHWFGGRIATIGLQGDTVLLKDLSEWGKTVRNPVPAASMWVGNDHYIIEDVGGLFAVHWHNDKMARPIRIGMSETGLPAGLPQEVVNTLQTLCDMKHAKGSDEGA